MPLLGTKVGVGPGGIVLDCQLTPKGAQSPIFGPHLLWPNGYMLIATFCTPTWAK